MISVARTPLPAAPLRVLGPITQGPTACLTDGLTWCLLLLPQAPQRYLMGVRLGTRLLSSCRAKNQKLASTAAAQQALDVLESEESQAAAINSL